jgi:hypothetical protein
MNAAQRRKLKRKIKNTICPNCGEKGLHYIQAPPFAWRLNIGVEGGFWSCPKMYGPDGRRLPEHIENEKHSSNMSSLQVLGDALSLMKKHQTNMFYDIFRNSI